MSDGSKIEWTEATWNPTVGCTKVSPGCDNCYAERIVNRFKGKGAFDVVVRDESKLFLPFKWRKPRRIFVNSMSDLFHEDIPDSFIANVFSVMARTPQHTYQILTKRHGRMRSLLNRQSFRDNTLSLAADAGWPMANVWLGVSVEDQKWADIRIPALLDSPAAVRWLSCEPLLGPVDLLPYLHHQCDCDPPGHRRESEYGPRPDWIVVGGESGPGARPMHPAWARSLRDQCTAVGVPFFFKQWGAWQDGSHDPRTQRGADHVVLLDGRHVEFSAYADSDLVKGDPALRYDACIMSRVGKATAGRVLGDRTWDEYPQAVSA